MTRIQSAYTRSSINRHDSKPVADPELWLWEISKITRGVSNIGKDFKGEHFVSAPGNTDSGWPYSSTAK